MANEKVIALTATGERPASTASGYVMLIVLLVAIVADIYGISRLANAGFRRVERRPALSEHHRAGVERGPEPVAGTLLMIGIAMFRAHRARTAVNHQTPPLI